MKAKHLLVVLVAILFMLAMFTACDSEKTGDDTPNGNGECVHQYDTWSITRKATCSSDGVQSRTCEKCGYMETQAISALGHTEVVDKAGKEATCTDTGLTEQKHCSVCNAVLNQTVIPAKGHTKVIDEAGKAVTCTDAGWSEGSHCSVCNVVLSEKKAIDATGHVEATDLAKAATCTATGLTEGKHCSVCNYVIVKQNTIPATGHTVVVDAAVAATCTATGLTEGSHCSTCNTTLVKQNTVAKLSSHTYVSGVCKHCGKSNPNYVPTYSAGETWTVDGQFEFCVDSVVEHALCDSYRNENYGFTNMFGVMVNYHYKNIGYSSELKITYSSINVYDEETEKATVYSSGIWCDHEKSASACITGTKASASYVYALSNESSSVTVYVSVKDSNGTTHKAQFIVNVTPVEEEPEEDKLNGCTINLGTSLPQTISYYTYSGSKQSSCSVTEVSFEVSGDDLYIYFTGRKTYDSRGSGQSDSCKIGWKLYDNNNNVIDSGTAYTLSIATGEGFVKTKDTAYNCITAGGTYKLVLLNVN